MKIQSIPLFGGKEKANEGTARVFMLEVSGPIDDHNPVLARARELVLSTGSKAMVDSFEWSLQNGVLPLRK